MRVLLLGLAAIMLCGCYGRLRKRGAGDVPEMELRSENLRTVTVTDPPQDDERCHLNRLVDSVAFVRLSNEPEATIGGIEQLEVRNGVIAIRDQWSTKSIKVFSMDGRWLHNVGYYGRGPGEFLEPTYMQLYDDGFIVWDQFSQKLLFYNHDGKHMRSIEFPFMAMRFHYIDDDHIFFNTLSSDNYKYPEILDYMVFETNTRHEILSRAIYGWKNDAYHNTECIIMIYRQLSKTGNKTTRTITLQRFTFT